MGRTISPTIPIKSHLGEPSRYRKEAIAEVESNEGSTDDNVNTEDLFASNEIKILGVNVHKNTISCLELALLFVLTLIIGAGIFHAIEQPNELRQKEENIEYFDSNYTEIIQILHNSNCAGNMTATLEVYEKLRKLSPGFADRPTRDSLWGFSDAFIFSFTIVTTIGYGTFAPNTASGQLFLVIYALIGIPITGMSLGFIAERVLYIFTWMSKVGKDKVGIAFREFDEDDSGELDEEEFKEAVKTLGFDLNPVEFKKLWCQVDVDGGGTIDLEEFREAIEFMNADVTEAAGQRNKVIITLIGILSWIVFGMIVFWLLEGWSIDNTIYFIFVSLLTIGLGDYFPTTDGGLAFLVLFSMVGLGLVATLLTLIEGLFADLEKRRSNTIKAAKEKKEAINQLKKIRFFADTSQDVMNTLAEKANKIQYNPNIEIIKEGTELDIFFVLLSGNVSLFDRSSGENIAISAPSFLSESTILNNPNTFLAEATIRTEDHVEVLSINRDDFLELFDMRVAKNEETRIDLQDISIASTFDTNTTSLKTVSDLNYTVHVHEPTPPQQNPITLTDELNRIPILLP